MLDALARMHGTKTGAVKAALRIASDVYAHHAARGTDTPSAALSAYVQASRELVPDRLGGRVADADRALALGLGYSESAGEAIDDVRVTLRMIADDRNRPAGERELADAVTALAMACRQLSDRLAAVEALATD